MRGLDRELARVVEIAGVIATHIEPVPTQGIHHLRRGAPSAPTAGGGVDDQADGSRHRASVLSAPRPTTRGRVGAGREPLVEGVAITVGSPG